MKLNLGVVSEIWLHEHQLPSNYLAFYHPRFGGFAWDSPTARYRGTVKTKPVVGAQQGDREDNGGIVVVRDGVIWLLGVPSLQLAVRPYFSSAQRMTCMTLPYCLAMETTFSP